MESPTERIEHRLNKLKSIKSVYELIHDTYKRIGMDKTDSPNLPLPYSFTNTYKCIEMDVTKPSDDRIQLFDNVFYDFYCKHQKITKGEEPLTIGIVGTFKTGKSTLINSLIGEKLMGVDVLPATACISILKYGDEPKFIAIYKDGTNKSLTRGEYIELSARQYDQDIEVKYVENNHNYIEVYHPSEILRQYNIIDTPGLSSLSKSDDEITMDWIGKVDLLLWVFDGFKGSIDREEIRLLKSLKEREIVAVVNKLDLKDSHDERKKIVDVISNLYPFKAVLCYAAQPILERRNTFENIQKMALNYVDNGKEVEIHYEECKFSIIDKKSKKEIDAYALPHLNGKEFINYFHGFKTYLEELKEEINRLKLEKLEKDLDLHFLQQKKELGQVKDNLIKELEKGEKIFDEKKKRIENFKNDILNKAAIEFGNIEEILDHNNKIFEIMFECNENSGFWNPYTVRLNIRNEYHLKNILRNHFGSVLIDIYHSYHDFTNKNAFPNNINEDRVLLLIDWYVNNFYNGFRGVTWIWENIKTPDKKVFEGWKERIKRYIHYAISTELIRDIIIKDIESNLNKLQADSDKENSKYRSRIQNCIDIINGVIAKS